MEQKEFSKFQIAQLKRTAQNVEQSVKRKNRLEKQIIELSQAYKQAKEEIDAWQAPIKAVFHGHTTEELVESVTTDTGKLDKNGKPIKVTKFVLKYPETIIPIENVESAPVEPTPEVEPAEEPESEVNNDVNDLPFGD